MSVKHRQQNQNNFYCVGMILCLCIFVSSGSCSQLWYLQNQWKSLALICMGVFIFLAFMCTGKNVLAGLAGLEDNLLLFILLTSVTKTNLLKSKERKARIFSFQKDHLCCIREQQYRSRASGCTSSFIPLRGARTAQVWSSNCNVTD